MADPDLLSRLPGVLEKLNGNKGPYAVMNQDPVTIRRQLPQTIEDTVLTFRPADNQGNGLAAGLRPVCSVDALPGKSLIRMRLAAIREGFCDK